MPQREAGLIDHGDQRHIGAAVAEPVTRTRQSALRAHGLGSVTGIARATRSAASIQTKVNTLAGGGLHPH
jgi:hypothetical protein